MTTEPPRLADALLRRVLPIGKRGDSILGDLREEFKTIEQGRVARRWYWKQALRLTLRYAAQPAAVARPDRRRPGMFMDLTIDLRTAFRMIKRSPGTSSIIVVTLSLAIAAATIGFAFADLALFRGLPVDDPSRVVSIFSSDTRGSNPRARVSMPDFVDYHARSQTLERMAVFREGRAALIEHGRSRTLTVARGSADVFASIGQPAVVGRGFSPGDDRPGAAPVAVLSHRYWRDEFGGRADAIGRELQIGRDVFTVVGVISSEIEFGSLAEIDLWLPLHPSPDGPRDARDLRFTARLRAGVTFDQAAAELAAIGDALSVEHPQTNGGWRVRLIPIRDLTGGAGFMVVVTLFLLSIGLLMAIATANVSSLVIGRAAARERELAVRLALGARGSRLVRQFLTEGMVLSLAAAALSLPAAWAGLHAIGTFSPEPVFQQVQIDLHECLFVAVLALVCPMIFSLAPARIVAGPDVRHVLAAGGSRGVTVSDRGRGLLVVAQVALAVVLLTASSLALRSVRETLSGPIGIDRTALLTFALDFNDAQYPEARLARAAAVATRDALASVPGVRGVAMFDRLPLLGGEIMTTLTVDHQEASPGDARPTALFTAASDDAGRVLGVTLLAGRWWEDGTRDSAVISLQAATRYFGGVDAAIGRHLTFSRSTGEVTLAVAGVVSDVAGRDRDPVPPPRAWIPMSDEERRLGVLVRAEAPGALSGRVREILTTTAPAVPIEDLRTLDEALRLGETSDYVVIGILGGFALLALLLAATGLFGVVSYSVARRTPEFGTRMALGASTGSVVRLVWRRSLALLVAGLCVGLAGGVGVGFTMRSLLAGTSPMDPVAIGGVAALLAGVSLVATAVPAWRAARIDPVVALRAE